MNYILNFIAIERLFPSNVTNVFSANVFIRPANKKITYRNFVLSDDISSLIALDDSKSNTFLKEIAYSHPQRRRVHRYIS